MGIWKVILTPWWYLYLFSISILCQIYDYNFIIRFLTLAVAMKCWTKFPFSNIFWYQFIWQIGYELTCVKLKVMTGLPKVSITSLVFCFIKSCCTRLKISIKWALGFSSMSQVVLVFINPIQPRVTFEPSIQKMLLVLSGHLPGKSNV